MKCDICGNDLAVTFLKKIVGTYVKDDKGKLHPICRACQKNLQEKDKILAQLK